MPEHPDSIATVGFQSKGYLTYLFSTENRGALLPSFLLKPKRTKYKGCVSGVLTRNYLFTRAASSTKRRQKTLQ
jgi:hypothetical protein